MLVTLLGIKRAQNSGTLTLLEVKTGNIWQWRQNLKFFLKIMGRTSSGLLSAHSSINADRHIQVLGQNMLSSRQCICPGWPCLLQRDNAIRHYNSAPTAWLWSNDSRCWSGLQTFLTGHPKKKFGRTLKWSKSCLMHECENIPLPKDTATGQVFSMCSFKANRKRFGAFLLTLCKTC